jgi:hypothetical protein
MVHVSGPAMRRVRAGDVHQDQLMIGRLGSKLADSRLRGTRTVYGVVVRCLEGGGAVQLAFRAANVATPHREEQPSSGPWQTKIYPSTATSVRRQKVAIA